jgi:RimJ/RimL family protein N-acetyltransferase
MRIIPASVAQADPIRLTLGAVAAERRFLALVEAPSLAEAQVFLEASAASGSPYFVACDDNGAILGGCSVFRDPREGFHHVGQLGMFVAQEHRRAGIGRALLNAALAAAWESEMERVELEVYDDNVAAISLYERKGFEHEGRKRAARKLDGITQDVVVMALLR